LGENSLSVWIEKSEMRWCGLSVLFGNISKFRIQSPNTSKGKMLYFSPEMKTLVEKCKSYPQMFSHFNVLFVLWPRQNIGVVTAKCQTLGWEVLGSSHILFLCP
jgi:hypothetical protein